MGVAATLARIRRDFHFPRLQQMVEDFIHGCKTCQTRNRNPKAQQHTLVSVNEDYPFQKISVDFVGPLQPSSKGNTHILTVKDTFSRWLEAYPTKDTTSKNIASILSQNIFCRFGMPEQIHSDQGPNFVSELLRHVYESLEIQPSTTPAYNPKSSIWSEWRLTVIAATVRIALADILDLSEVDIPAGVFLHPAVGWG